MKHTNFTEEIDYEQAPESWIVQAFWLTPAILLIGYIISRIIL